MKVKKSCYAREYINTREIRQYFIYRSFEKVKVQEIQWFLIFSLTIKDIVNPNFILHKELFLNLCMSELKKCPFTIIEIEALG